MCLAIPGKILNVLGNDPLSRMAVVSFSGVKKEISLAFVPEAKAGDHVIVHVAFAISILDEEAALESLNYFRQLDETAAGRAVE
jgi:hydrogenase expression/formation protein HypC